MRTLLIGALAATLVGCSGPSRQAGIQACTDASRFPCFDETAAGPPIELKPASFKSTIVANAKRPSSTHARDRDPGKPLGNGDAEKTAPASPNNTDLLVAILMTGPEIKSVSELANKNVAMDARLSASSSSVRNAIAAAGAAKVQLSEGQTTALDRVTNREVPAAVLALASPEAAEQFPEIAGFKIFRIPLSPRSAVR